MNRANEGGSVLSFVVIGSILALLLVGGVYFVRQQMNAQAGPTPEQTRSPEPTPPETKPNDSTTENKDQSDEKNDQSTPAGSTIPGQAPPQTTTTLPETGLAENISALLAMALLSGTFIAYLRSRREYVSL